MAILGFCHQTLIARHKLFSFFGSMFRDIYIYVWYSPQTHSLEVAIKRWLEWDLNPRLLNSVQTF